MWIDDLARSIAGVWRANAWWMGWNLFLALVPVAIGLVLFRARRHTPLWWAGAAAFVAFLPNAPYVITDVIHLPADVRAHPDGVVVFGILPLYVGFIAVGLVAYAVALRSLAAHLHREGWSVGRITAVELGLHAACAVGVFLGRVPRLNSWDLVVRPGDVVATVSSAASTFAVAAVLLLFVVLVPTTALVRWSVDAAAERLASMPRNLGRLPWRLGRL